MSPSTFERIPGDVLHEVAVFLGGLTFLGPPSEVCSMLLLSKDVHDKVSWPHVYADIFRQKFDVLAPVRRLGDECTHVDALAAELVKRSKTLKRLRNDAYLDLDAELLTLDLWTSYLMFLENQGKNAQQLVAYARVATFASNYVSPGGPLHVGANHGSIVDSENNALALLLFWFTDSHRVKHETSTGRRTTYRLFWKLITSLMSPSTTFPLTTFRIPDANPGIPVAPQSIDGPLRGLACTIPDHFGFKLTVTRPLLSSPLYLSNVVRSWTRDANDLRSVEAALVDWGDDQTGIVDGAKSYDADWARLRPYDDLRLRPATRPHAVFKPGTLHGKWVGRYQVFHELDGLLLQAGVVNPVPMQLHIREHHQVRQDDVLGYDDSGLVNAWLPKKTTMKEVENDLRVYDPNTQQSSTYRTYHPDAVAGNDVNEDEIPQDDNGLYGANLHDILITAKTDETFGQRWGHFRLEGRVRDCDGLVMLVRRSAEERRRCIFYGEIHGGRTIVGRWQDTISLISNPESSGVWCMTKEDE